MPPTNQKTEGTCQRVPKEPKSSLAGEVTEILKDSDGTDDAVEDIEFEATTPGVISGTQPGAHGMIIWSVCSEGLRMGGTSPAPPGGNHRAGLGSDWISATSLRCRTNFAYFG